MPIAFRSKCRQNHALEINTKVMVAKNIQPEVFGNDVIRGGGRVKGRDRGELTKGNKKLSQRDHNPPIIYEPPSPKTFSSARSSL
jgi:hypothetical protein